MTSPVTVISSAEHATLLERYRKDPPEWARKRILGWNEPAWQRMRPFVCKKYWSDRHSVNVFTVVGTQHPDYVGLTWLEFLERGKRMPQNLALQVENPVYYFQTTPREPPMYFISTDGQRWYVAGDGNHRTAIARFAFEADGERTLLHAVHVEDYRIDWRMYEVFQALESALMRTGGAARVEAVSTRSARADTAGWMRETYDVKIKLVAFEHDQRAERLLDAPAAETLLASLNRRGGRLVRFLKVFRGG